MKRESIVGFVTFFVLISGVFLVLEVNMAVRFLIGLAFGFFLVRASIGFAGSVNKLYRAHSAQVAKTIILIMLLSSVFVAFIMSGNETSYKLSIYPINFGLLIGGLLFGIGMAFSSCCATGSLTDISSGFFRAVVTIIFFSIGVFLGFDIQANSSLVNDSFLTSAMGENFQGGVFLPDLFLFDGFNGYLGAIILTAFLGFLAISVAKKFEKVTCSTEEETLSLFEKIFVKPWKTQVSVVAISATFAFLFYYSQKGWSASSAFGIWFGKFLMLFGVKAESISEYTSRDIALFVEPITTHSTSMQNIGIVLGATTALLIAGSFSQKFIAGLKISPKGALTYAGGGFLMGIGTRLSNGCNVGALYTPIVQFSLSGWIYMLFVVGGGVLGNRILEKYIFKSCATS